MPESTDDHVCRQLSDGHDAASRARIVDGSRRRRGYLIAAIVVLCAAVIGLAVMYNSRPGAARRTPIEPKVAQSATGSAPGQRSQLERKSDPSKLTPVPDSFDALKQESLAMAMKLRKRYAEASEVVDLLASMHDRFGNLAEATRIWEQWLAEHPNSAEAHFRLGRYAKERGDESLAVTHLQAAFKLKPSLPGIQVQLGESLTNAGRAEDAVAVLEADVRATRNNPNRIFLLGHAYLQKQDYQRAKDAFAKVLEIDPQYTHALFGLGTACAKLGQPEEAKMHLEEYGKRKGQGIAADRDKASTRLSDLPDLRQVAANWYTTAGAIYARQGDLGQAESHWLRATALSATHRECRLALIELYRRQGKNRQAAQMAAEIDSPRQGN